MANKKTGEAGRNENTRKFREFAKKCREDLDYAARFLNQYKSNLDIKAVSLELGMGRSALYYNPDIRRKNVNGSYDGELQELLDELKKKGLFQVREIDEGVNSARSSSQASARAQARLQKMELELVAANAQIKSLEAQLKKKTIEKDIFNDNGRVVW